MKVDIAASHRFHLLNLAVELQRLDYDVRFYSYVPPWRCRSYGLSLRSCIWLFWVLPFVAIDRRFGTNLRNRVMDVSVAFLQRRADAFVGLSNVYLESFRRARRRGVTTVLERGSTHVLEQQRILSALPSSKAGGAVPAENIRRELAGYDLADFISVASRHVASSFTSRGVPQSKVIVNPYGVDLASFAVTESRVRAYDVLMVGGWSYRKGCDVLVTACQQLGLSLLHVGPLVDLAFPTVAGFEHRAAVDQRDLPAVYSEARVFCLPSREEGLAMVQLQAVAAGLPLVCSSRSGGADLVNYLPEDAPIFVVEDLGAEALKQHLLSALEVSRSHSTNPYRGARLEELSWGAYGRRYSDFLQRAALVH